MKNINDLEIVTPRLVLRRPLLDDVDTVHQSMSRVWNELQLWMSWAYDGHETREAVETFIASSLEQENNNSALLGFNHSGRFVLSTGLHVIEDKPDEYNTGYWVDQDFLGQGYATEATNAIIRYAFNEVGAKAMHINYFADNQKSRRVIEKLGFTYIQTLPAAHKRCSNGEMLDSHEYIMTEISSLPPLDVSWHRKNE